MEASRTPQRPLSRLGSKDPRGTSSRSEYLTNFHLHVSPRRSQTDAPNAMARTPQRCTDPSLSNSNKATKAIGGIGEEEQEGRTQNSPRSRSQRFTHKEMIWFGQSVDLELLSLFLKYEQELWREWRERKISSSQRVKQWRGKLERERE